MSQSALYRKFQNNFVGPKLTRKQLKTLLAAQKPEIPVLFPIKKNTENSVVLNISTRITRKDRQVIATPKWVDKKAIKQIYEQSKEITNQTGVKHHVDI